ncbi:MAG: rhomboid family intramembrane serine protease [Kiritimatiellae bacterium]|nr:rhomboid family intramembrane serine protease [Kiritimatiellia bacterium]
MSEFDRAWNWERDRGRIVWAIVGATVAAYLAQLFAWRAGGAAWILRELALSRGGVQSGRLWQFATYQLLHGSPGHLLMNMIGLALLGPEVARALGPGRFAALYAGSGVLGGLGYVLLDRHPCLGASGAVFGVMAAFATLHPRRPMMLLLLPFFTLPAWLMVLGVMLLELVYLVEGFQGGVAHSAHLAGALAGAVYTRTVVGGTWGIGDGLRRWGRRWEHPRGCSDAGSEDVDRILDKVARGGLRALTRRERELLEAASRRLRGWER